MLDVMSRRACELRASIRCDTVYIMTSLSRHFHFLFVIEAILRNLNLYFLIKIIVYF